MSALTANWRESSGAPRQDDLHRVPCRPASVGFEAIGFCFDNETPWHQVYLEPYAIASRLVRNSDWLEFIEDAGYQTPSLWMSDGWATVQRGRVDRAVVLA